MTDDRPVDADDPLDAREYHERTKHSPQSVRESGWRLDFDNKPTPYKTYVDLPRQPLPDDPPEPETPALRAIAADRADPPRPAFGDLDPAEIDRETLAQLCFYAAGVTTAIRRGGRTLEFRAAATTGALYHVDLYPVCGDLADLEAGVYHYDPRTDSLDVLRRGDYRGVLADVSADDRVVEAPITLVATSTWWRNAWKYRARTFRHAFWDSGTIVANLLAVAHARGLPASAVLAFADDLVADLLGVDSSEEAPLELVPIGADDPVPETGTGDAIELDRIDPETAPLSPNPKAFPLIPRAWRAGTLDDGVAAGEWRRSAVESAPIGTREPGGGDRVPLDPVDRETASARPLGNAVVRRGSCREYEREPISFRKLSTVLDRAVRGAPLDVRGTDGGFAPSVDEPLSFVDPYLIVNAVEGLEPGSYRYDPSAGELERLERGEFRREAGHLALDQRLAADAAVCCYFLTDLDAIVDALGDRGYRVAQFEAALTAGRLYLATYAHRSLGGTGLTFYDDVVTDFFEPSARGRTPTFLYTMGRPA